MYFVDLFKKNKVAFITLSLIVLIILLLGTLYYLDSFNKKAFNKQQASTSTIGSDLKGYNALKQKINALASDTSIAENGYYLRLINKLNIVEDKNTSEQNRYKALLDAAYFLETFYSSTNNPKLHTLNNDLDVFAKTNFPKYYKPISFLYYCQDSTCTEAPQPKEILNVIDEINSSNIPDLIKKSHVRNLINIGYIEKKYVRPIAQGYLLTANMMRADEDLKKEGLNKKLADELNNFVKKTYPDIYQEFVKTATLSAELSSGK